MSFNFAKNTAHVFVLSLCLFCVACIIGVILVLFLIKCCIFSKMHSISKWVVGFAVSASIFYILASIFNGIYWFYFVGVYNNEMIANICDLIQLLFFHLGQLMVYCYLLNRIYKGFEGTIYSFSWKQYILLSILLVCYLAACLAIFGYIIWYIIWCDIHGMTGFDDLPIEIIQFEYTYRIVTLCTDLILSTSLLMVFTQKLFKISKNLDTLVDNNGKNSDLSASINEQNILIYKINIYTIISKVVILGTIMIVSSQIVFILSLCNWIMNRNSNESITFIYGWFKIFHTFIGSLCLFLGFEFVNNWYMFLCGKCHKKIKKWCLMRMSYDFTFTGQIQ